MADSTQEKYFGEGGFEHFYAKLVSKLKRKANVDLSNVDLSSVDFTNANVVKKTGDTMTGGLAVQQEWGGFYLKDSTGIDGIFEKNSNTGAVNLGTFKDENNHQFITVGPETASLDQSLTFTRTVDGDSATYKIPTYIASTTDLTAGSSELPTGVIYLVYEE